MKKSFSFVFLVLFSALFLQTQSFAASWDISREDAFIFFASQKKDIPESFQYIRLNFLDVKKNSDIEDALQKLVYTNAIKNTARKISPAQTLSQYEFYALAKSILKIESPIISDASADTPANSADFEKIKALIPVSSSGKVSIQVNSPTSGLTKKEKIFFDVYETLQDEHYNAESFTQDGLINGAIKGLTQETGDKYTTYFPPVESSDFFESLEGSYEGIWAYVEMPTPGKLIIISPIVGSPAETAGLKGGDHVTHIDGKLITENNTLSEVVSWIKWPAQSSVELTVIREWEKDPLKISVTRAKITIKDVEYKRLDNATFYIQLKNFGESSDSDFTTALSELKMYPQVKKLIIDVRNNPGGYLTEVSDILGHFVPAGEATAKVRTADAESAYKSHGYSTIDPLAYQIVILQNGGSASASEILAGTLKDYYPNAMIIGEKSFGKGSVQSLKNYYDGSTLKYTSAKWFTGKTAIWIDWVGIMPDIELKYDDELYRKSKIDNQLQTALDY